jgi:Protein of unknown function (DUF2637)
MGIIRRSLVQDPATADRTVSDLGPGMAEVAAGPMSGLDRLTLHLGVLVAAVIAGCSYAVSATSLYALGRTAGYSWWQAAAVPVVADGPAIYGMVRIVARARRGARGAGYGWLLVWAGTGCSMAGNVAHARPDWVARGIAAVIPLAVLAMLEALKGDAQEVTRLTAQASPGPSGADTWTATPTTLGQADSRPGDGLADTTVRRADFPDTAGAGVDTTDVGQLAAPPAGADAGVQQRLQAAYRQGRLDGRPWTARSLAQAAGCGRTAAATFLQAQRTPAGESTL